MNKTASILIYDDQVHNHGLLWRALRDSGVTPGFCSASDIIDGALDQARLLVMPGGADLYFCEALNGAGNRAIRQFVENGGHYLGLCAGAYYGCRTIAWAANDRANRICGERQLRFYEGKATGPIYQWLEDGDIDKSWLAAATITFDETEARVFYEGGPVFSEPEDEQAQVLARYKDLPDAPPAIIECRVGRGLAILSGPHIERRMPDAQMKLYAHKNPGYGYEKQVHEKLAPDAAVQQAIWNAVLKRLGV